MSYFDRSDCKIKKASHMLHDVYLNWNTDRHEALYCAYSAHYHSVITGMYDGYCSLY